MCKPPPQQQRTPPATATAGPSLAVTQAFSDSMKQGGIGKPSVAHLNAGSTLVLDLWLFPGWPVVVLRRTPSASKAAQWHMDQASVVSFSQLNWTQYKRDPEHMEVNCPGCFCLVLVHDQTSWSLTSRKNLMVSRSQPALLSEFP